MAAQVTNAALSERVENIIKTLVRIENISASTETSLSHLNLVYNVEHQKLATIAERADKEVTRAHDRINALLSAVTHLEHTVDKMATILKWVVGVGTTLLTGLLVAWFRSLLGY